MKKALFLVLLLMFCFSLYGQNQPNKESVFVQKIVNSECDVSYKIFREIDDKAYISITDDVNKDLEVRVLTNNVTDALSAVFSFEEALADLKRKRYKDDESSFLYNSFRDSFVKTFIMQPKVLDHLEDCGKENRWVQDSATGKFYFEINKRDELVEYKKETEVESEEIADPNVVTLTVLDYQDITAPSSFYDNKIIWEAFEQAHPDIKIKRICLFDEPFHIKTKEYVESGVMPDVFFMWPSAKSYLIHEKKLAKDLRPFLKRDGIYDDYSIVSLASFRQDCFYLAEIPFGDTQTCCLYTNKKILKELGLEPAKTYNELKAQLPILKAAGKELILMGNEDKWVLPTCLFSTVVGRIAGKNWAYNIKQGKTKFTDEPFLSAVKMIDKMYKDGIISRKSLFTDYDEVAIQFAEEKGAYLIDGDWRCSEFITNKLTNTALISYERQSSDFEVFLFPSLPGEVLAKSNSGTLGCGYGMSSALEEGSKKEEAAWELIKWLSGPTCQQRRLDTAITFPSLITGIDYSSLDFLTASVADFYTLPEDVTPVFSSKFNPNVANVLNDKLYELGMGKVTAMEVCEAVQAAYDAE